MLLSVAHHSLRLEPKVIGSFQDFIASMVNIFIFTVLLGSFIITVNRAKQLKEKQECTVIDIAASVIRIGIKLAVLLGGGVMVRLGLLGFASTGQVVEAATDQTISSVQPTGDSWLWARVVERVALIDSILVGFFSLFLGRVGHVMPQTPYNFWLESK